MTDLIKRLVAAMKLQMDQRHKSEAETKLWFEKAQEWSAENQRLRAEVEALRELLRDCHEVIDAQLDGEFPQLMGDILRAL